MTRLSFTLSIVRPLALAACLLLASAPSAAAQDRDPSLPPAHLSFVDGRVVVDHEGGSEDAEASMPIVPGDRLRTEDGRAEIGWSDGSLVQVDEASTVDVLAEDRLRLLEGRLVIVAARAQTSPLQVDTPQGTVSIDAPGEYRMRLFDADGRATLELSVVRGQAELASDADRVTVATGERSWARMGEAPAYPVRFNAAAFDTFDQWALDRAADRRGGSTSARYVPATLRPYAGTLDTYGSWDYEPSYGHVWYPRVEADWRPYYTGRWRHYGRLGWTWVGGGVWGWPTHHYGRWGLSSAGLWFWIPGTQWGPAWVSWAIASDYVSWCPIGYDNRPVIGWGVSHQARPRHGRERWHAWTVVPRREFGGHRTVSGIAVDGRRFDGSRGPRPTFVEQGRAPDPMRGHAIARRDGAVLGVAVPRDTGGSGASGRAPEPGRLAERAPRRFSAGSMADRPGTPPAAGGLNPVPRSRRPPTRLRGDIGQRLSPAPSGNAREPVAATERPRPSTGWRADQVPVHRGDRIAPSTQDDARHDRRSAPPGSVMSDRALPRPRRGDSESPLVRMPRADSGAVVPRGDSMASPTPGIRSRGDGYAAPRAGAAMPDHSQHAPQRVAPPPQQAPPPPPPPPPSAAPRRGPSSDRVGGAVPRGGPPPSRLR